MNRIFLKSSALLIAIIVGMVLMVLIVGVSAVVSEHSRTTGQSRDGKIAYRAALSGIEDGLLRYKFARANQKLSEVFGEFTDNKISSDRRGPKASYDFSISSTLPVGDPGNFTDFTKQQKAIMDNPIDIDLSPYRGLSKIEIHFTRPFQLDSSGLEKPVSDSFTAINVKLIDIAATAEKQLLHEQTNVDIAKNLLLEDAVGRCIEGTQCHLRIRPQLAKSIIGLPDARRIKGDDASGGKYVYIAIAIEPTQAVDSPSDKTGTIKITSIGIAGQARRKLEAKIDAGSGAYLGLFDWGIYCGKGCNWGTKGL